MIFLKLNIMFIAHQIMIILKLNTTHFNVSNICGELMILMFIVSLFVS